MYHCCYFGQNGQEISNGILLPKLFRLSVRKNCSSDPEKLLNISSYSVRGNYSFLNLEIQRSQYIRPKVTVHKYAEAASHLINLLCGQSRN